MRAPRSGSTGTRNIIHLREERCTADLEDCRTDHNLHFDFDVNDNNNDHNHIHHDYDGSTHHDNFDVNDYNHIHHDNDDSSGCGR